MKNEGVIMAVKVDCYTDRDEETYNTKGVELWAYLGDGPPLPGHLAAWAIGDGDDGGPFNVVVVGDDMHPNLDKPHMFFWHRLHRVLDLGFASPDPEYYEVSGREAMPRAANQ